MIRPFAAAKLLTFAALALGGCHVSGIRGNGDITTETRTVPDFTSVEASGAFTITWSNAPAALKITTDQNLLSRIETSVSGTKLAPPFAQPAQADGGNQSDPFELGTERRTADGRGASDCLETRRQRILPGGIGRHASESSMGRSTELMATMSGASRLDAESLQAETVEISISGAGKAEVAASKILKVAISGAGKSDLHRQPDGREAYQRRGQCPATGLRTKGRSAADSL